MTTTYTAPAAPHEPAAALLRQMKAPDFVARLTEERVAELRRGLQPHLAWHPWVFNSLTALLIMAGGAMLATTLPVALPAPFTGATEGVLPFFGAAVALAVIALLDTLFHAPVQHLHSLLTPLSGNHGQCQQALHLIQASQLCRDYQAQVLAHPREFLVADLLALEELAEREKQDAATRERQQVCAALHQLDAANK